MWWRPDGIADAGPGARILESASGHARRAATAWIAPPGKNVTDPYTIDKLHEIGILSGRRRRLTGLEWGR